MEKIEFKKVIEICSRFIESHGQNNAELIDLESKLVIKNYLPMEDKAVYITKAFLDADKDISVPSVFVSIGFDIAMLFDCLLAYTNINVDNIADEDKIYENYDIIYESGLGDYILSYCKADYKRICKMLDRALSMEHISSLLTSLDAIDSDALEDVTKAINDLKKNGDKDMIHDMAQISRFADPEFEGLREKITDEVLDRIYSNEE